MARNTSVTLGQHFDEFISEKIAQGRFQSVSEMVRAGLRKLKDDENIDIIGIPHHSMDVINHINKEKN